MQHFIFVLLGLSNRIFFCWSSQFPVHEILVYTLISDQCLIWRYYNEFYNLGNSIEAFCLFGLNVKLKTYCINRLNIHGERKRPRSAFFLANVPV